MGLSPVHRKAVCQREAPHSLTGNYIVFITLVSAVYQSKINNDLIKVKVLEPEICYINHNDRKVINYKSVNHYSLSHPSNNMYKMYTKS